MDYRGGSANGRRLSGEPSRASVSANGRRLIRSVCGSLCGVLISRGAWIVLVESSIFPYKVYGSAILKNYPTQDEILCLRLTPQTGAA